LSGLAAPQLAQTIAPSGLLSLMMCYCRTFLLNTEDATQEGGSLILAGANCWRLGGATFEELRPTSVPELAAAASQPGTEDVHP